MAAPEKARLGAAGTGGEPMMREGTVFWRAATVLAVGPEADLAAATAALGGWAGAYSDASAVVYDGRMRVAASGLCFDDGKEGSPLVVFTSVTAVAPFLARRSGPGGVDRRSSHRSLQPVVGSPLVPTTELFVIFPADRSIGEAADSSRPPKTVQATLVACIPVPQAEAAFQRLQANLAAAAAAAAGGAGGEAAGSSSSCKDCADISWQPPAVGCLGVAILHISAQSYATVRPSRQPAQLAELFGADGDEASADGPSALGGPASLTGRAVRLLASPFGALKPSLFLDVELRGHIAGASPEGALLLLDVRCLPGSEGGVVVLDDVDDNDAEERLAGTAVAESPYRGRCRAPLAMVAPPLRSADGERLALGVAVPFRAIGAAICRCLPPRARAATLGPALAAALTMGSCEGCRSDPASSSRTNLSPGAPLEDLPPWLAFEESVVDAAHSLSRSLCIITSRAQDLKAHALLLSRHGHWLTSADFAEALMKSQFSSDGLPLNCASRRRQVLGSSTSQCELHAYSGQWLCLVEASVLHVFRGISQGAALLSLRTPPADHCRGMESLMPVPWVLPLACELPPSVGGRVPNGSSLGRRPLVVHSSAAFQTGARICLLTLDSCPAAAALGPPLVSGILAHAHSPPTTWRPVLLECGLSTASWSSSSSSGHTGQSARGGRSAVVLHVGSPLSIMGFWVADLSGATAPRPTSAPALPYGCLALSSLEAAPLLQLLLLPKEEVEEGVLSPSEELSRLDATWAERLEAGAAQLLWRLDVGATAPKPPQLRAVAVNAAASAL
mmetsp:Transcript_66902/g.217617  ORF Transcript_66902/g.217617 Transcript_66902/m.217617 type:complete len:789 (-) Transcript_66902:126-2492(-)